MLFSLWLGAAYLRNAHVRVDVAVGGMSEKARARLELFGCLFLALPFLLVTLWYGYDFVLRSFMQNEGSPSPTGLPARYVIKFIFISGFALMLLAVLAVMARSVAVLRGADVRLVDGEGPRT
jgi:TRAP-type mannitol/chloroaromatic compound transport system permease small subunit